MSNISGKNAMKKVENNIQRGIRNATMRQSPGKANKPNRKYASWTGSTHKGPNAVLVALPPVMANGTMPPPTPSAPPMSMNQYKNMLKSQNYKGAMGKLNGGKSRRHRKSRKASRRRLTRRRR